MRFFAKNKLRARMIMTLLPACALPLFCFGYFAISSHFASLREESLANHRNLVSSMRNQLDADTKRVLMQLEKLSQNEVLQADSTSRIRETLASFRAFNPDLTVIYVLAEDGTVRASDPPASAQEGRAIPGVDLDDFDKDGVSISPLAPNDAMAPHFFATRQSFGSDAKVKGYVVVDAAFGAWMQASRGVVRKQRDMVAALLPTDKTRGVPISLASDVGGENVLWKQIAERLRSEAGTELEIGSEQHHITRETLDHLPVRLVVAQPLSSLYAAPRLVVLTFAIVIAASLLLLTILIAVVARGITTPIREVADATASLADGRLDVRALVKGSEETRALAAGFNQMCDSVQASQRRMKIMYKAIMELFACGDADALLKKAVELACTQCGADVAWFVPHRHGHAADYDKAPVFLGLHGWLWKDHGSSELPETAGVSAVWPSIDGDRVFPFVMKNQDQELGLTRVAFRKSPDEATISLLHSLMTLVETTLIKQEMIVRGALVSTELELAEVVQRNVMAENRELARSERVSFHYQPASRLGGDWFYLIEDDKNDCLYVILGDVTGHGLAQGLVTTAVKGALDVLEILLKGGNGVVDGPASLVSFLDRIVWRVAGTSELTMTCLAAQIDFRNNVLHVCNAGHTFPILVREDGAANVARHLYKHQHEMLGLTKDASGTKRYESTSYDLRPGDYLVLYTDGLSGAKNLKSEIFGRFLFRSLRQPRPFSSARAMKDDILAMFSYYTQGAPIDDDVCFLVVRMPQNVGRELNEKAAV